MKKAVLLSLLLVLSGCVRPPSVSDVQQAFAKEYPDYKVQAVLPDRQKEQDRYNAQFVIYYRKPSDPPEPLLPSPDHGHAEVWTFHREDGKWTVGKREVVL